LDTVSPVKCHANLLVGLNKALQLAVKVSVLAVEDTTMVSKSFNLAANVFVTCCHRLVGEAELFLITTIYIEIVFSYSMSLFQIVEVGREVTVTAQFPVGPAGQVGLLGEFRVEIAAQISLIIL